MLPDPDSNPELVAAPAERGISADPTLLADAASVSRDRRAGCPLATPSGKTLSATVWTATESNAPVPSACPFSTNAFVSQEHRRPGSKSDSQNETLEELQHPTAQHHSNSEETYIVTADVLGNQDANPLTDVENVLLETYQSDGSCDPCKEGTSSSIGGVFSSNIPVSPNDRRPTVDFDESDLQYLEEEGPEVVEFFRALLGEGCLKPGDCGVSLDSKPPWVDDAKVRLGQQFAQKYFFGLVFAEMISLFLLFSSPGSLCSLIFSGNSDTPFKAFRRYLSTVCRVRAWYSGDLWEAEGAARRNLRAVRQLHAVYRRRLNALNGAGPEERARRTELHPPLWTRGAADAVRHDFTAHALHARPDAADAADACPFFGLISSHHEWINQMEMSITQFGFVALAVTYPERFGAGGASDEELDAFLHLWRVLGYLLGVEDRFNFCAGGLEAVRRRSKALVRRFLAPALARVDASWEHMTRCVVEGVSYYVGGMTYEVALLYLCETVGVGAPRVLGTLSAQQRRIHRVASFVLRWALRVAPLRALFNWLLHVGIKRALAASPEWLRRREARVYDYERAPPPSPHAHAARTH